jgi:glycosyltransferase involved in cell wall biosynthesis
MNTTHVDLHVHSCHSNKPTYWAMRTFNIPESYTSPRYLYDAAKHAGMTHVTITDHNTINGALEIAHLPGVFVSSELTCHFPEDGCKVHVVVLGVTEAQFAELFRLRKNIYECVAYLNQNSIAHFLAHPLYAQNDKLSAVHIEKNLLLFSTFEVRNGSRSWRFNRFTERMLAALTPQTIERLANQHTIEPVGSQPWNKGLVGGSDDHSGLFIGRANTAVVGGETIESYLEAVKNGHCTPAGDSGDPLTLAHSMYGIGYSFYREQLKGRIGGSTPFIKLLVGKFFDQPHSEPLTVWDRAKLLLRRNWPEAWENGDGKSFEELLDREAQKLLSDQGFIDSLGGEERNRRIFAITSRLANRMLYRYTEQLTRRRFEGGLPGLFNSLGTIGLVHLLASPYYFAFHHQHRGKELMARLEQRLSIPSEGVEKIALFTDTLDEINGVAITIRRLIGVARQRGVALTVISSGEAPTGFKDGVMQFQSLGKVGLPEYPELKLHFPPVLEIMDYLEKEGFTSIHISTPGTVGLLGLLLGKLMDLPLAGTYHTDIPQYVHKLTNDGFLEQVAWSYMIWFYGQMGEVMVPSVATREQLVARGLERGKTLPLPRWVDTQQFAPAHCRSGYYHIKGITDGPVLLYVGRVSREKGLDLLSVAFRRLIDEGGTAGLAIVGDGPYRMELEQELSGYPTLFTGFLQGSELSVAYASADLFVFPSATDTFGNVVLEAQASGLAVIVTDQGGPQELMQDNETGLLFEAGSSQSLYEALCRLLQSPALLREMGGRARHFVEEQAPAATDTFSTILKISSPAD